VARSGGVASRGRTGHWQGHLTKSSGPLSGDPDSGKSLTFVPNSRGSFPLYLLALSRYVPNTGDHNWEWLSDDVEVDVRNAASARAWKHGPIETVTSNADMRDDQTWPAADSRRTASN